ncbi:MAG: glycosyl hydrolase, partial [Bacteroidota bacterium]
EIRWGVAIADHIEGPYIKSPYNPITQSGHEICVWPYKGGIALAHCVDGPEKETIQLSPDGINFEIMAYVEDVPEAMGLVTTFDNDEHPTAALTWGLCHESVVYPGESWMSGDNFIKRFSFSPNKRTIANTQGK